MTWILPILFINLIIIGYLIMANLDKFLNKFEQSENDSEGSIVLIIGLSKIADEIKCYCQKAGIKHTTISHVYQTKELESHKIILSLSTSDITNLLSVKLLNKSNDTICFSLCNDRAYEKIYKEFDDSNYLIYQDNEIDITNYIIKILEEAQ